MLSFLKDSRQSSLFGINSDDDCSSEQDEGE